MNILTTEQARALRTADAVCFYLKADGTSSIHADFRSTDYATERSEIIPAATHSVNDYSGASGPYSGFAAVMSSKYDNPWQTIARRIRKGSSLHLRWVRANQSPVLDEAGLVRDELSIAVVNGNTCDWFTVAVQVGKDNTARMIRFAR